MTAVEVAPVPVATTSELLLAWDRKRPRSQQTELGMSEVGGCKRRAGYRLAGTVPTNPGGSVQAVMGTAIHDAVAQILASFAGPDDLVEQEVRYAGVLGHLDRYEAATSTVIDVKTTSSRWLEHIKTHGPDDDHLFQIHLYAGALWAQDVRATQVRLDYLARDSGEEWQWSAPFDPVVLRRALAWVAEVRDTDLGMLPREYAPTSAFCRHCPFALTCWDGGLPDRDPRSVLFVEDPDAKKWAEQLWQARADAKAASARAAEAKGALDALRPDLAEGETATVDVGWRMPLRWRKKRGARSLDKKAIEADYEKAGAKVPIKVATGALELGFEGDDAEKDS